MDFNSRCKKLGYSYTSPVMMSSAPTLMEMKREVADNIFRSRRDKVKVHDCRDEKLVDFRDKHLWEAWLLSHGVRQTSQSVSALYRTPAEEQLMNQVDKHMFTIGKRGTAKGDFEYPRGLTVDEEGNIFVADTKNHRIQVFNQFGIYKKKFGEKGSGDGQLDCPTGVAVMPNEDVAVAELKNKRVQIFSSTFKFKSQFATVDEPIALVSDRQFTLIVATSRATVEVYRRLGKLQHKFALNVPKGVKKSSPCVVFIAVNNKDEVLVSDPASCSLTFYKYDGTPLYRFEPPAASEGLGFVPAGVDFDMLGNIVVADSLNHVVNVYSERGALLRHHAGPVDDMGAVQALVLGMDGHLVVIECTSNGPHCVKIFRYMDCECHKERPGSSLCQSPVPTDVE